MNTRLVNTAAGVINAALTTNRTAAGIALALESAQLLMSPEIAAELERFRGLELGDTDGRVSAACGDPGHPTWLRAKDDTRRCPWCRVDEMEAERATTNRALVDTTLAQREAEGRPADEDPIAFALTPAADAVAPLAVDRSVAKLRALLAGQREQAGGAS